MVKSMVARATSSLLIGPDWARNVEICDFLNHSPGQAKDVVKGIKKRLRNKNPKVQLLTITLLETIVKNCGDIVHMQVAEKDIPHEMARIAKKKPDIHVKEKILILIDTWQEAFGGHRAQYPQYYAAYHELLRAGAVFPHKPERSAPVFTPPQTQPLSSYPLNLRNPESHQEAAQASLAEHGYPTLSLTELQNAREIMDVLTEMLSAIDPASKEAVREDVIVDLVEQCRTYKQRVVYLVNSTLDESLLCQGLTLNDDLEKILAKHEALASGNGLQPENSQPESRKGLVNANGPLLDTGESSKQADARSASSSTIPAPSGNGSAATPTKRDPPIDLLSGDLISGDDFNTPSAQDALALVPVSAPQPHSPVSSQQNALALYDMFATNNTTPDSSNSQHAFSASQGYPSTPEFQQYQNLHAGHPQPAGVSWNGQTGQQQPQSPAYGAQNGRTLPPPPWESQPTETNQPFSPQYLSPMAGQQSPSFQGGMHPFAPQPGGAEVAGMYSQQMTGHMPPMNPQQMHSHPGVYPQPYSGQMAGMVPQGMPPSQMGLMYPAQMYANQMGGYGYAQQPETQYLDQRMYGMTLRDKSSLRSSSNQTSTASYLPPMRQPPKGDDKLFGDLVDMAKLKPK